MASKLFAKQILRATLPSGEVDIPKLTELVTSAYEETNRDRRRTDRSIALMIEELDHLNRDLERLVAERTSELQAQNSRFDAALNNMTQGLSMFDAEARLVVCNRRYIEMFGMSAEVATPGRPLREILQHRIAGGTYSGDLDEIIPAFLAAIAAGTSISDTVELRDGRVVVVAHRPMAGGGWVSTHEDVTDRWRAEKQIAHMAHHDTLTDLPNRVLFREELAGALTRIKASGKQIAILYLDLDHFKGVNDTLGHPFGDELLKAVAARLRGCVSETDLIARLGGDEFAVIQTATNQPAEAAALAARICERVKAPFKVWNHQVVVDISIGISIAPVDGSKTDDLLRNADLALYDAKAKGRGIYRFFEAALDEEMRSRRAMELDLRNALANGEFELYYQPIFDLAENEIGGWEALIRWHHPTHGMILPGEFIPMAEEIGLITAIGEWVLATACREAASWPSRVKVAVNLSAIQLKSETIEQFLVTTLAASGLSPSRLELEITEAVLLRDTDATIARLYRMRQHGVRFVMDDFGTGYSSLSYLRRFPFEKIKIDRSFISELHEKEESRAIVQAIVGLALSLGMQTTAEGVETQLQLDMIRALGCAEAQGYLIGRPQPAREVVRSIRPDVAAKSDAA